MKKAKPSQTEKKNGVTIAPWTGHPAYKWRVSYPDGAKRRSKGFTKKTGQGGAIEFAEKQRGAIALDGTRHEAITPQERRWVLSFRDLVAELPDSVDKPTLGDAISHFRETYKIRHKTKTVLQIIDDYLLMLQRRNLSKDYLYSTGKRMERFAAAYGDWLACDLTPEIVVDWLEGLALGNTSTNHYRTCLVQLFNYALEMEVVAKNPAAKVHKKKVIPTEIGILTVKEAQALLNVCSNEILPGIALGLFAGIRRQELCRMDWGELDFEQQLITIAAAKAKTASRRLIPLRSNLAKWLMPHFRKSGPIMPTEMIYRSRLNAAMEVAQIKQWPHNCLRHSFASYHLAAFQDAAALALEMGHSNTRMIFEHYRALVPPKEGKRFWKIVPTS